MVVINAFCLPDRNSSSTVFIVVNLKLQLAGHTRFLCVTITPSLKSVGCSGLLCVYVCISFVFPCPLNYSYPWKWQLTKNIPRTRLAAAYRKYLVEAMIGTCSVNRCKHTNTNGITLFISCCFFNVVIICSIRRFRCCPLCQ